MNRESLVYTPNSMCIYIYMYVISCFVVITSYLSILVLVKISKSSEQEVEEIEKKYIFLKASIMSIYIYKERERERERERKFFALLFWVVFWFFTRFVLPFQCFCEKFFWRKNNWIRKIHWKHAVSTSEILRTTLHIIKAIEKNWINWEPQVVGTKFPKH